MEKEQAIFGGKLVIPAEVKEFVAQATLEQLQHLNRYLKMEIKNYKARQVVSELDEIVDSGFGLATDKQ